ncbi:PDZ domain-containing protein [Planctomycetota bacterium]
MTRKVGLTVLCIISLFVFGSYTVMSKSPSGELPELNEDGFTGRVCRETDNIPDVDILSIIKLEGIDQSPLLSAFSGESRELMQSDWEPEEPFDLSGPLPKDEEVRQAIMLAVNYLMEEQNEDGSWDVMLTGTWLSQTADQALDACVVTALCGLALRPHVAVNPVKVQEAVTKAANFIMDRILRGKLPKNIWYAVWRYSLGLKFIHSEYVSTEDTDRRTELREVAESMLDSLFEIQLIKKGLPKSILKYLEMESKSGSSRKTKRSTKLGIVLEDVQETASSKGFVRIKEIIDGYAAAAAGLQVEDIIVEINKEPLSSRYEFYEKEINYMSGDELDFKIRRGIEDLEIPVKLLDTWPVYLGLDLEEVDGSLKVKAFLPKSPSKKKIAVGDILTHLDDSEVRSLKDFHDAKNSIKIGSTVKITLMRKGRQIKKSFKCPAAPPGSVGRVGLLEEDKSDLDGVPIAKVPDTSHAARNGLQDGDRLMQIDFMPIKGRDHYINLVTTIPAGKLVTLQVLRMNKDTGEREMIALNGTMEVMYIPASLGVRWHPNATGAVIGSIIKGGMAAKYKLKTGDRIIAINEKNTPNPKKVQEILRSITAGSEVKLKIQRKNSVFQLTVEIGMIDLKANNIETGGWAYYPEMGEATSFTTSTVIITLADVIKDMKLKMTSFRKRRLDLATKLIWQKLRVGKAYKYRGATDGNLLGAQGRTTCCDLAMVIAGRRSKNELGASLKLWMKHRCELDRVRNFEGTHYYPLYANAAYYWLFSHYNNMLAANYIGGGAKKKIGQIVLKALMLKRNDDGTWFGHKAFGPVCGTAQALMIFGLIDGKFRDDYSGSEE